MMLFPRIPSRPVRYAIIATHAMRDALDNYEVDFTRAEQALADKVDALTTKVDALLERLQAYEEETIDGNEQEETKPATANTKAKTKASGRGATRKGRTASKK